MTDALKKTVHNMIIINTKCREGSALRESMNKLFEDCEKMTENIIDDIDIIKNVAPLMNSNPDDFLKDIVNFSKESK